MRNLLSFFAVLIVLWIAPVVASACSCAPEVGESDQARVMNASKNASAVFVGKVVKVKKVKDPATGLPIELIVEFKVDRAWNGVSKPRIAVQTAGNSAACGFEFRKGISYMVYAGGDKQLSVYSCSRTSMLMTSGSADEQYLGVPSYIGPWKKK
jgi:hypothetical protein